MHACAGHKKTPPSSFWLLHSDFKLGIKHVESGLWTLDWCESGVTKLGQCQASVSQQQLAAASRLPLLTGGRVCQRKYDFTSNWLCSTPGPIPGCCFAQASKLAAHTQFLSACTENKLKGTLLLLLSLVWAVFLEITVGLTGCPKEEPLEIGYCWCKIFYRLDALSTIQPTVWRHWMQVTGLLHRLKMYVCCVEWFKWPDCKPLWKSLYGECWFC